MKALEREPAGMSDGGGTEPDARPLTADEGHSVLFTMAAMLSLEDDMTVVSSLNGRLTPMEGSRDAELGEPDASGPTAPVSLGGGRVSGEGQEARAAQQRPHHPCSPMTSSGGEVIMPP
ncbi:hypothetical protein [Streptomyces sp. TRM75563]|uniref:hypothetical protein n=1 Tax=Streptomyces sp. TRM75563 TaxID=2817418 RepID=UPI001F608B6F|nr:hypothetical protein [Streptomyces sp. TRM75563]MCI4041411.1 hypothetical protein [Streptomyces sp. TRM75563]